VSYEMMESFEVFHEVSFVTFKVSVTWDKRCLNISE
jgi:hypothetical protein